VLDLLAAQVEQQRRMQGAVVARMRDDERRGQHVAGVQHHSTLVGVDLEDPQGVGQFGHPRTGAGRLNPRRQAVLHRAVGPLLPGDRRSTEMQGEIPLQRQVQRQEPQRVIRLPYLATIRRRKRTWIPAGTVSASGAHSWVP
jgi:hypothetical protein